MYEIREIIMYLIEVAVMAGAFIIAKYVAPYVKAALESSKYSFIADMVVDAVHYAEQKIQESGKGKNKKAIVISLITGLLDKKGIQYEYEYIDALIEAAVFDMNKDKDKE